jgi:hypothetical protein
MRNRGHRPVNHIQTCQLFSLANLKRKSSNEGIFPDQQNLYSRLDIKSTAPHQQRKHKPNKIGYSSASNHRLIHLTHFHPSSPLAFCNASISFIYFALSGPFPVTTIKTRGNTFMSSRFTSRACRSYNLRASRRILKSSSGVHDVLDTRSAGRSSLYSGSVIRDKDGEGEESLSEVDGVGSVGGTAVGEFSVVVVVKGVEYGEEYGGRNETRTGK